MVRLAKTAIEDLSDIMSMERHEENIPFILSYSYAEHLQAIKGPKQEHLKIIAGEENKVVGFVLLTDVNNPHQSINLKRIVVGEKGKGFGREALKLVKDYCFKQLHCHRLWLDVFDDNTRARHLYQTEGFKEEGILRECIKKEGIYKSLVVMSILENEYILLQ